MRRTTGTVKIRAPLLELVSLKRVNVNNAQSVAVEDIRIWRTDHIFTSIQSQSTSVSVKTAICDQRGATVVFSGNFTGVLQILVARDVSAEPSDRGAERAATRFAAGVAGSFKNQGEP